MPSVATKEKREKFEMAEADEGPSAKKHKRECSYRSEWQSSGVSASKRGANFAHYDICGSEFKIGHGGIGDVKKHIATAKHQEMARVSNSNTSLRAYFRQSPLEESVTRAEVLFANFIAEHNLPFLLADHFTCLTSVMFPDSQIAKAFKSAHTKTTCIVTGALHPYFAQPIDKLCQENPFSILCDEGSDNDDKNFAILVRLWDEKLGKPVTRFLDMSVCNVGTADKLFERQIPYSIV